MLNMPPVVDNYTEKLRSRAWFACITNMNKSKFSPIYASTEIGLSLPTVQITACIKRTIGKLKGTPHFQLVHERHALKSVRALPTHKSR